MSPSQQEKDDRLFVRDGRRSYRRTFSLTEFRLGLGLGVVVVVVLALITTWLLWKGAHPDPALFAASVGTDAPAATTTTDRGPLPPALAVPGWHERTLAWLDATNLYVKINGREDYYKSFGFQRLGFVSLVHEADTTRIVDVEFFDQGSAANALGAQAGERSQEQETRVGAIARHMARAAQVFEA